MLDNVEVIMYMKFQKILMTWCRDMDKNIKNTTKMRVLPNLWPPKIFFQKSGSVTFVPLSCSNFMQKLRKNNERSLTYLNDGPTDGRTTDQWTKAITKVPSGKPGVQQRLLLRTPRVNLGSKIRKTQWAVSEVFKDGHTTVGPTDKGDY